MTNPHGSFIWYELITPDPDAAAHFYGAVVGWKAEGYHGDAGPEGGMDYRIWTLGDGAAGGLMQTPEGGKPGWYGYIGVDDVDDTLAAALDKGATLQMPPRDVPGVGRIAMIADPGGIPIYLMRGASDQDSTAFAPGTLGRCGWNELLATDLGEARDFYLSLFGWSQTEAMPMGEMGEYQFLDHGGQRIGAMMQCPPGPTPHWHHYWTVKDIEAAKEAILANGGTIFMGPMQVPGGGFIIQGFDPQGIGFEIVSTPMTA